MSKGTNSAMKGDAPTIMPKENSTIPKYPPPKTVEVRRKADPSEDLPKDLVVELQCVEDDYDPIRLAEIRRAGQRDFDPCKHLWPGPPEVLHDVRGRMFQFTLDGNGFTYIYAPTKFNNWASQPATAKHFLPEMEDLLQREVSGCDEIVFYRARLLHRIGSREYEQRLDCDALVSQVKRGETDATAIENTLELVRHSGNHLSGRVRVVHIWRPVKHPMHDWGIAVADGSKLNDQDVSNKVYDCDKAVVIPHQAGLKWYYMSRQDEPNVIIFKEYDTALDVPARICLHTEFEIPPEQIPPNTPSRDSIQIQAVVSTHPESTQSESGTLRSHPLAGYFQQGGLQRLNIRRLESIRDALTAERDGLQRELRQCQSILGFSRERIELQSACNDDLKSKVLSLEDQMSKERNYLLDQIENLSEALRNMRMSQQVRTDDEGADNAPNEHNLHGSEKKRLLAVIAEQKLHIEKWKEEAMGYGNEAVSRCWQASVDEAIRRERDKDSFVIKALQDEIKGLKAIK